MCTYSLIGAWPEFHHPTTYLCEEVEEVENMEEGVHIFCTIYI
jgi:hypothetical protein